MTDFQGRHVVVTGGAGSLGSAVVGALLERGASCHVPARTDAEADAFVHRGRDRVRIARGVDLASESQAETFYAGCPPLWASIHIAGGFAMAPVERTALADFRNMLDTNAVSCFLCCREAVKSIRRAADPLGGRIVNVGARPAITPMGGMLAYAASKAAVVSMTQCLSEEVGPEGIFVNAVIPSIMDTPANRRAMPDADHAKWTSVEDVARTILFLASPENRSTRGALAPVCGRS